MRPLASIKINSWLRPWNVSVSALYGVIYPEIQHRWKAIQLVYTVSTDSRIDDNNPMIMLSPEIKSSRVVMDAEVNALLVFVFSCCSRTLSKQHSVKPAESVQSIVHVQQARGSKGALAPYLFSTRGKFAPY